MSIVRFRLASALIVTGALLAACQPASIAGEGAAFQGIVAPDVIFNGRGTIVIDGVVATGPEPVGAALDFFDSAGTMVLTGDIGAVPGLRLSADFTGRAPGQAPFRTAYLRVPQDDGAARVYDGAGRVTITEIVAGAAESGAGDRVRGRYEGRFCDPQMPGACVAVSGAFAFDN